jgi:hypothetical protein
MILSIMVLVKIAHGKIILSKISHYMMTFYRMTSK